MKIAIQGGLGSFHHQATQIFFGNPQISVLPCFTFYDVFGALRSNEADLAILAIENNIAGSILENYTLLKESGYRIAGELFLRIRQNLLALPGQSIPNLQAVYSHPMAIMQTRPFFEKYPHIQVIASADTAMSAEEISRKRLQKTGAIAGKLAAQIFGLELLAEGIETLQKNQTRFLLIEPKLFKSVADELISKATLTFELPHKKGSLSQILSVLAYYDMNLTKIQSMPILEREWDYSFYIDLIFEDYQRYRQAIDAIAPLLHKLQILGEYEAGKQYLD